MNGDCPFQMDCPFPMAYSNTSDSPHVLVYGKGKKITIPPGKMLWLPGHIGAHWEDKEKQ